MSFAKSTKSKRPGHDRRWTLLFIGDHGNVITLRRFKAIVMATGFVFCMIMGALAVLIFLNAVAVKENKGFQRRIEISRKQIETLRHEKEILMARLVLAEAQSKKDRADVQPGPRGKKSFAQITQQLPAESQDKTLIATELPPAKATPQPDPASPESEPLLSVAVEKFEVSHKSDSENLIAQFKIKNTSPQLQKVDGHAVVVLKGNDLAKHKWLVMPAVRMVGGKPSGKRGQRFAIQRFRMMNFTFRPPSYSDELQTASVYVFSKSGELLLEKDFPIKMPPQPVATSQRPAEQMPAVENPPAQKPPVQTPSAGSPPAQLPAEETTSQEKPSNDDPLKSVKSIPPVF